MITKRSKIIILAFISILIHTHIYSQINPISLAVKEILQKHLTWLYSIEKLKGMTTIEGNRAVNTAYENAKREVNTNYDKAILLAYNKYTFSIRNESTKALRDNNYQANQYKIYKEKGRKIEHSRKLDLNRLKQQYDEIKKSFYPFWSRNDFNGKMKNEL